MAGTPRWRHKHLSESNSNVPNTPGVYAIGHQESLHGLELKRVYVYVGETQNLNRRLDEHLPDTEQNANLRSYLRKNYPDTVCWYVPTASNETRPMQDDLIRELQPKFNAVGRNPHRRRCADE